MSNFWFVQGILSQSLLFSLGVTLSFVFCTFLARLRYIYKLAHGINELPIDKRKSMMIARRLSIVSALIASAVLVRMPETYNFYLWLTSVLLLLNLLQEAILSLVMRIVSNWPKVDEERIKEQIRIIFRFNITIFEILLITSAVRLAWLLPHYDQVRSILVGLRAFLPTFSEPVASIVTLLAGPFPSSAAFMKWTVYLLALILALELWPAAHSTVRRINLFGSLISLVKALATACAVLVLLLMPESLVTLRNVVLATIVFCGSLTALRQFRRRWRTGDRSLVSLFGGLIVVIQFLSLLFLAGAAMAILLTIPLRFALYWHPLYQESHAAGTAGIDIWAQNFASMMFVLSFFYLSMFIIRRLTGARGLSWFDPPNFRVLTQHTIYTHTSKVDRLREAFVRHIVQGAGDDLDKAVDDAAQIRPPVSPGPDFRFTIIGDPGEGDESQLYSIRGARTDLLQQAVRGSEKAAPAQQVPPGSANDKSVDPNFVIISSDVVYPAGEHMDYERAVYRPYRTKEKGPPPAHPPLRLPIYAIPGNHDWYDDLGGFLVNFGYSAAHEPTDDGDIRARRMRTGPWASANPVVRWLRWLSVERLRNTYGLENLGGAPKCTEQQQRLPFFELSFGDVPLTILGIDTGCNGSVDNLQYDWLERCLRRADADEKIKLVLLSAPLYVDGAFNKQRMNREIYELLRRYRVDVVMAGDTHTYQHYQVDYTAPDGIRRTMHHIVNGGGGAFLSPPMDMHWQFSYCQSPLELDQRFVYHDDRAGSDRVTLYDLFPTMADMKAKFSSPQEAAQQEPNEFAPFGNVRTWYESWILQQGWTTGLEHDREPLLQSFVEAHMLYEAQEGWILELMPRRAESSAAQAEPQESRWQPKLIEIRAPSAVLHEAMAGKS